MRRLGEALVVLTLLLGLGLVIYGGGKGLIDSSRAAQRNADRAKLKQIVMALHSYFDDYNRFPSAVTEGPDGRPWHSWRAFVLPYLDDVQGQVDYRFNEPWDSPHNKAQVELAGTAFGRRGSQGGLGNCEVVAVVGRWTMWRGRTTLRPGDFYENNWPNKIMLMMDRGREQPWSQPEDLSEGDALFRLWTRPGEKPKLELVALCDGRTEVVSNLTNVERVKCLLAANDKPHPSRDWPKYLKGMSFSQSRDLPTVPAASVPELDVTPVRTSALRAGVSTLWCATMQLSWDRVRDELRGMPLVVRGAEPLCAELNRRRYVSSPVSAGSMSMQCQVVGVEIRLHTELKKIMPFADPFEKINGNLQFQGTRDKWLVQTFGTRGDFDGEDRPAYPQQVEIVEYVSGDEFTVALRTNGPEKDLMLLAKVEPEATLEETWQKVLGKWKQTRPADLNPRMTERESLIIPMMAFDYERSYTELLDRPLHELPGGRITRADQRVRFVLDEAGGDLFSSVDLNVVGSMGGDEEKKPERPQPRAFVFGKPYLMAVLEEGKDEPFLLMWVDSPALTEEP